MNESAAFGGVPETKFAGSGTEDQKGRVGARIENNFVNNRAEITDGELKRLRSLEYPKQDYEKVAIADINKALNSILTEVNVEPFDVPEKNIYIIPESLVREVNGEGSNAFALPERKSIIINAEKYVHPRERVEAILHEMIHLKGFLSMEVRADGEEDIRRVGIEAHSTLKDTSGGPSFKHFIGLNEAVVSELEKRLLPLILRTNPLTELQYSQDELVRVRRIASERDIPESEIIFAQGMDSEKDENSQWSLFPYKRERDVLNYIVDGVFKKNPDTFTTRDDVFKLFLQAHFQGSLLPLARVIKSTFGSEALRMIGMMTPKDQESPAKVMQYLKKNIC